MRDGYPLVELHRHLDGNVRLETILDLGRKHHLPLPAWTMEELRPYVQVTTPTPGIMAFIAKFEWMQWAMVDYDAVRRIVYENLEDAVHEQIDYIELRFSPYFMGLKHGLDPVGVAEAACDALEEARGRLPIRAKLIGIMSRTYGPEVCWQELEAAIRYRDRGIVAVDLAGDEANFPGDLFVEHFRQAREAGLHVTVHAGEAAGPESVRQAVLELGAERIGHAVRAVEDTATLDLLAERQIGIESCLTSNVQTSTVPDYASHPLLFFLRRALLVTLNTDDPGVSGIDLAHEYHIAETELGLTPPELHRLQENAIQVAFLTDEERVELLSEVPVTSEVSGT
ncbi:MAG TPA: adenosine deaminase [Anaerolineae bacterium]|nr:adenosine deaminase [Anaerolineae bacterium]HIQ06567.1 adenosine deaminase [Anaerolineae bacterium]